ncbi:MAG TPA: BON domain-containing protein [Candidatus Acidoferrum sp.]|nr:BON domain-containing protein [Candidatus Acidoferrum sp.]
MSQFNRSNSRGFLAIAAVLAMVFASSSAAFAAKNQPPKQAAKSEVDLSKEVRHRLVMLPYLTLFDNLAYKVDGSSVTLMGYVVNPTLKSDAGNVVKNIEGVTQVNNEIKVLPPSSMDWQIRRAEYRAIYGFAGLWKYAMGALPPVHIVVDNGHVMLFGVVDSEADKNLIGLRAKTVPNVFSVTNNLQVASSGK